MRVGQERGRPLRAAASHRKSQRLLQPIASLPAAVREAARGAARAAEPDSGADDLPLLRTRPPNDSTQTRRFDEPRKKHTERFHNWSCRRARRRARLACRLGDVLKPAAQVAPGVPVSASASLGRASHAPDVCEMAGEPNVAIVFRDRDCRDQRESGNAGRATVASGNAQLARCSPCPSIRQPVTASRSGWLATPSRGYPNNLDSASWRRAMGESLEAVPKLLQLATDHAMNNGRRVRP